MRFGEILPITWLIIILAGGALSDQSDYETYLKGNIPVSGSNGLGNNFQVPINPKCLHPSQLALASLSGLDLSFLSTFRVWYISGGSRFGYKRYAETFLGRSPFNQAELNQMCLAKVFNGTGLFTGPGPCINYGYGVHFQEDCNPLPPPGGVGCDIDYNSNTYDGKLGVNPFLSARHTDYYLLKTDSVTYAIYYFCNNGIGDYELKTVRPFATAAVVSEMKKIVVQYGFDPKEILLMTCSAPRLGIPYPYPFQNYPYSSHQKQC